MIKFFYIPVMTLVLVVTLCAGLVKYKFDPLEAAQNPRLTFKKDDITSKPLPANNNSTISILYIGNSQILTLMDKQPGDDLAPAWLLNTLNRDSTKGRYVVKQDGLPNLRMTEVLLKSMDAATNGKNYPDIIVAGIVLDGFRQLEPRSELTDKDSLSANVKKELSQILKSSPDMILAGNIFNSLYKVDKSADNPEILQTNAEEPKSLAGRWEESLQTQLESVSLLFKKRKDIHALFILYYTYARNKLFGLSTSTTRPISPIVYKANLEVLEMTLRYLKGKNVRAVFYLAPIRPLEPSPYLPRDIQKIREDLPALCKKYGAFCLDYGNLVPEKDWINYHASEGSGFANQPDFAHFTGRGHKRLGEQLAHDLKPHLAEWLALKNQRVTLNPPTP